MPCVVQHNGGYISDNRMNFIFGTSERGSLERAFDALQAELDAMGVSDGLTRQQEGGWLAGGGIEACACEGACRRGACKPASLAGRHAHGSGSAVVGCPLAWCAGCSTCGPASFLGRLFLTISTVTARLLHLPSPPQCPLVHAERPA